MANSLKGEEKSRPVNVFRGRPLPLTATLAGYSYLIKEFNLDVPLPPSLAAVAGRHRRRELNGWLVLPEQYAPTTFSGQIAFAFKWEGVDLAVLDALFRKVPLNELSAAIESTPTGAYMRRLWFLYEWMRDEQLPLKDLGKVRAVNAIDEKLQIALPSGPISSRHKVRNNLPGSREFCPLVRRTETIKKFEEAKLAERTKAVLRRTHPDVITRASQFLLLNDSRASYRIEGEEPSPDRAMRWGHAIKRAGTTRPSIDELEALQRIVIGDARFVHLGLRIEGGFVGQHDRLTRAPIPDHISARAEDLPSLVEGLVTYDEMAGKGAIDPVTAAAVAAFGFVYIHPFEDGNGRIHRWLIHHILAASGFAPPGIAFPVSAVMLRELERYRLVLESYSRPLLERIQWRATPAGNVEILNDTSAWYRYFDATAHAEFLYHCVEVTITHDLPEEIAFLEAYDRFVETVKSVVDMPSRTLDLLHRFLSQNGGHLSQRAREKEFAALTDDEAAEIERLFAHAHADGSSE